MNIKRDWATPITIGAFFLSAVTGVLMFFHWDIGLNKLAHEWLSWILLIGVSLHMLSNFTSFKKYFSLRKAQVLMGIFALVLALSFIPAGEKGEPPFIPPMKALSAAPLSTLALVANITPEELMDRLLEAGISADSTQQSLNDLSGNDMRQQIQILKQLLAKKE